MDIFEAARVNNIKAIKTCIKNGENINKLNDEKQSALHIAIKNGSLAAVALLLENDANAGALTMGVTTSPILEYAQEILATKPDCNTQQQITDLLHAACITDQFLFLWAVDLPSVLKTISLAEKLKCDKITLSPQICTVLQARIELSYTTLDLDIPEDMKDNIKILHSSLEDDSKSEMVESSAHQSPDTVTTVTTVGADAMGEYDPGYEA